MKKLFLFIFLIGSFTICAQEYQDESADEYETDYTEFYNDTLVYNKTIEPYQKRTFKEELNKKYNGKEFTYTDQLKKEKAKEPKKDKKPSDSEMNLDFLTSFGSFMSNVFPYLLGLLVVFIIFKTFIKTDASFWNFKKRVRTETTEQKLYEEDDTIDANDYESLLKRAISNKDYRLATRYYYLASLQKLSEKELIQYHKDKTNTEYQFELKNKELRTGFAYLSYLYDYIWYGEFPVDEFRFSSVEKKYNTFMRAIK